MMDEASPHTTNVQYHHNDMQHWGSHFSLVKQLAHLADGPTLYTRCEELGVIDSLRPPISYRFR
jgi:hypothetical protein